MTGLLDCNSFYASCEQAFDPSIRGRPVVVLSNNDGCVIARSKEAKAVGVKMGEPIFQLKKLVREKGVVVRSSNYELYADMSSRVMSVLTGIIGEVEYYSIDEMFLDLSGFDRSQLESIGRELVFKVGQYTGIPVCLGVGHSKALAKLANKVAKKHPETGGYCILSNAAERQKWMAGFPVGDLWGIGRRYAALLEGEGVATAGDFAALPKKWVQERMTVTGRRLWEELNGLATSELSKQAKRKKNICTSRSFGKMVGGIGELSEAVTSFAAITAEKLRKEGSVCGTLIVFVHSNRFRPELPQYGNSMAMKLPVATSSTIELTRHALSLLKQVYRPGFQYKKAGVMAFALSDASAVQGNLFEGYPSEKHTKLMAVMDGLNGRHGSGTLKMASSGTEQKWKLRQENRSPRWTTRWGELWVAR